MRAHMGNRFVPRAEIPVARRRENDVARAWRVRDRRDLYDAVGVVTVDGRVIGGARVDASKVGAEAERVAALAAIGEAITIEDDNGLAALPGAHLTTALLVR